MDFCWVCGSKVYEGKLRFWLPGFPNYGTVIDFKWDPSGFQPEFLGRCPRHLCHCKIFTYSISLRLFQFPKGNGDMKKAVFRGLEGMTS